MWLAWLACTDEPPGGPPGADADADADSDTDTDADVDTDRHTGAPPPTPSAETAGAGPDRPSRLEVSCDATGNPLRFVCGVSVEPPQPVEIRYARADGRSVPLVARGEATTSRHDLDLALLAPETAYTLVASATAWPDEPVVAGELTTGPVRAAVASGLEVSGTPTMAWMGTAHPCARDAHAVIYDASTGDLVWYQDLDPEGAFGPSDMVRFTADDTVIGETGGHVVEVDLSGRDLARFEVRAPGPFGLHHDIDRQGANYWSFYQSIRGDLVLDDVVVYDPTGLVLATWRASEHLPVPGDASGVWLHTNSIDVTDDGDFVLSFLERASIGRFRGDWTAPDFGEPVWILAGGDDTTLGDDLRLDWSRVPGPDTFARQHDAHFRADGRLTLLDNEHGRGLVIALDPASGTATVEEAHPTPEAQCGAQGTTTDTTTGTTVVGCSGPRVRESDVARPEPTWSATVRCRSGEPPFVVRWYPLEVRSLR